MDYKELNHSDLGKAFVDLFADIEVDYDSELYHHGIKNMKWGVRRYQNKDGSLTDAGRKRYNSLKKKAAKMISKAKKAAARKKAAKAAVEAANKASSKPKKIEDMDDAELKLAVDRLRLEQQYRDFMKDLHPDKKAKAVAFVSDILESPIKNIGKQATTYILGATVNKIAKKHFGIDNMVNPKKGQKD